jgi:uncharacterized spore protein YtfJ
MALEQIKDMLRGVAETAKVETVFGESREIAGRTIIPVARVMYGGGGGGGQGKAQEGQEGTGGGGGMGVKVQPLGVFVITADTERFVAALDLTRVILAGSALALAGILTIRKVMLHRHRHHRGDLIT